MPLPAGLARFNKKVTNRITTPFARRLPWFGVVRHVGRETGKAYETPLMCWVDHSAITIVLTYGSDVDWLKNLVSAGGGEMVVGGEIVQFETPVLLDAREGRSRIPAVIKGVLPAIDVDEFVELPLA